MSMWYDHVRQGIIDEMWHSVHKHGVTTADPVRGALNLCEEAGEVADQALGATRANITNEAKVDALGGMIYELNQVAAYAILLRISMEGELRKAKGASEV